MLFICHARRSILVSIAVGCAAACAPQFPETIVYQGEHLHYASAVDTEICRGSFLVQDEYIETLSSKFGIENPGAVNFALVDASELEGYCELPDLIGCYRDGNIYSSQAVHFHEIVHAVAKGSGYHGPRSFQEGLAEVFGDGLDLAGEGRDIRETLQNFTLDRPSFYTMNLFVRFLIERHDLDLLLVFMKKTRDMSYSEYAGVFASVFGESLDLAMADFADYPACSPWQNHIALWGCGMENAPWTGDQWQVRVELDCARDDVLGPYRIDEDMFIWTERSLQIEADGNYLLAPGPDASEGDTIVLTRCGSCWDSLMVPVNPTAPPAMASLPAGQYHVLFAKDVNETGTTGLVVTKPTKP